MTLAGKTILVTGSTDGVGRRVALHLAEAGAEVGEVERDGSEGWRRQAEQARACFAKLGPRSNRKRPVRDQELIMATTLPNLPASVTASNGKRYIEVHLPLLSCHPKVLELILV